MALMEIEFELAARQYELMGYRGLKQGEPLDVVLDAGVLLPDPAASAWFVVQPEPLPAQFVRVDRGTYAFTGQIRAAEFANDEGMETATLLVECGETPLRVTCAPREDGRLPYGTWETRTLTGVARIQGIVEDDFATAIGRSVGVTLWGFDRLVLRPGDALFGQWHESDAVLPLPYVYDRLVVRARLHRSRV